MCPRGDRLFLFAFVAALLLGAGASARDDLSTYLERLGLDELRAAHLEQRLDEGGEATARLAELLAQVYGNLLERASDPDRRAELETRLLRILDGPLAGASPELRLPLLRSRYRLIEDVAERARLSLDEPGELDRVPGMLDVVATELIALESLVSRRVDMLRERLNRSAQSVSAAIRFDMERAADRQAQITFLIAWADYYRLMFSDDPAFGRAAEQRFGRLLNLEPSELLPENVTLELRGEEAVARCILGMALVRARLRSPASAMPWLELLESASAWAPLRERLSSWRLVVLIEGGDSSEALRQLREYEADGDAIDVAVLRMGAVAGLRSSAHDLDTEALRAWCMQRLAADGEFAQLHDLAMRFGLSRMGGSRGFAMRYVTGIVRLHESRTLSESDEERSRTALREAAEAFTAAIASSDAERFPEAVTECIRLSAVVQLEIGSYRAAGESFAVAASRLAGVRAADAHVAAVNAFERLVDADASDESARQRMHDLVDRFAARFPGDPRVVVMRMRRAMRSQTPSLEDVDELLRVPSDAPAARDARLVAADLLFRIYRAEEHAQARAELALRYLNLALPVHHDLTRTIDPDDDGEITTFSVMSRRILEIVLLPGTEQPIEAQRVLDDLEQVMRLRPDRFAEIEAEVRYRRMRERLLADAVDEAVAAAARVRSVDPDGHWARVADQTMFAFADRRWRAIVAAGDGDDRLVIDLMREFGAPLADRLIAEDPQRSRVETIAVLARVAEAELIRMLRSGDRAAGERARERIESALEARPRDTGLLRTRARLAEALDEPERALECWRLLVAGLSRGSPAWFEARAGQIRNLARTDPATARSVLREHSVLYPQYGPEPWGEEIRALDLAVPGYERGAAP